MDKKGFTLVELLVVIAMLMVLMGSVSSSIYAARRRAKISAATVACQEMTNAILAYENYGRNYSLDSHLLNAAEATESRLGFILGKESRQDGGQGNIPVLYNASVRGGKILDPWGMSYRVTIERQTASVDGGDDASGTMATSVYFPNISRIPAK